LPSSRSKRRGLPLASLKLDVLDLLRAAGTRGATKREIVAAIGEREQTSDVSVQRALTELRLEHDARIEYEGVGRRWRLVAPLHLPFTAPDREDLVAVLVAQAILEPIADDALRERIGKLVEELDDRVRARESSDALPTASSVSATLTLGTRVDAQVLRTLLTTCRRRVLRIAYASPWRNEAAPREYTIEPWAVRVHDGAAYLRAYGREAGAPRTFRVADIERVEVLEQTSAGGKPLARVPPTAAVWVDGEPAFGIDRDRPGEAIVRLEGSVARWVSKVWWHPAQRDTWGDGGVLERRLAYRSCRELARRIVSVIDGVVGMEPAELRDEVGRLLRAGLRGVAGYESAEAPEASRVLPEHLLRVSPSDADPNASRGGAAVDPPRTFELARSREPK
jgi:predicted DNA-binding transcriptional regulator YafY